MIQFYKAADAEQVCGTHGIRFAVPSVQQNIKGFDIQFRTQPDEFVIGGCNAADPLLAPAFFKRKMNASQFGGLLECNGSRLPCKNQGTELLPCTQPFRNACLLCKQEGFFLLGHVKVDLATNLQIVTTVQELPGSDGVLPVHHIVVTIPEADLRLIGNPLVKFFCDAGNTSGVKSTLISVARHDQFAAVQAHLMVRFYNCVHHKGTSFFFCRKSIPDWIIEPIFFFSLSDKRKLEYRS